MFSAGARAGAGLVCAAAIALLSGGPSLAQGKLKPWSDQSVQCIMQYAWQLTPPTYTGPDGKTIKVDKKNKKSVDVPMEVGRAAVEVGRVSALAQSCGLAEEEVANQRTFMRREAAKKWSDQQMLYIRTVHLTTVMLLNGQLSAKDRDTGKMMGDGEALPLCQNVDIKPKHAKDLPPCTDKQKDQVRALINAYINTK